MKDDAGDLAENYGILEPYDEYYFLTKNSGLLGFIELEGYDPDSMDAEERKSLSALAQVVYGNLHPNITITQYYIHHDQAQLVPRVREASIPSKIAARRASYLNGKKPNASRIIHVLEIEPGNNINKLNLFQKLSYAVAAPFNKRSRDIFKHSISFENNYAFELSVLSEMRNELHNAIQQVLSRWSNQFNVYHLRVQEYWPIQIFLATLDPAVLQSKKSELVPDRDSDMYLSPGDITDITTANINVMKISGVTNTYARFAAVRKFANETAPMQAGLWISSQDKKGNPVGLRGNYVIMIRWKPLTAIQKDLAFFRKRTELEQASVSLMDILKGSDQKSDAEREASIKYSIKKQLKSLNIAESLPERFGFGHSYICIFGTDPKEIQKTSNAMDTAAGNIRINLTWETVSSDRAYRAFQPAQQYQTNRNQYLTASQFAAASLIYRASIGVRKVADMNDEEPYYYLNSRDGSLFGYSPLLGGRGLIVSVGPVRSGKTYFKNSVATHFPKYKGLYRAIDVDDGTEPIADFYGDDGAVFRVSNTVGRGFNIFTSCRGPNDSAFKAHFIEVTNLMLLANDSAEAKKLTIDEEKERDQALDTVLRLGERKGKHLTTFASFYAHVGQSLKTKFSKWVRPDPASATSVASGWYSYLFDSDTDAIGSVHKQFAVFNLRELRDQPTIILPVLCEIFYRITQAFEDPAWLHVPKILDMDEAHVGLSIPEIRSYIVKKIRTQSKDFASTQLHSQAPGEFAILDDWSVIRGAASTLLFFANAGLDAKAYKEAFPELTDAHLQTIRNLVPRKEAFLIQPDLKIHKVVVIDAEPEQQLINTSHPAERALRNRMIKEHGYDKGMELALAELMPKWADKNEYELPEAA